MAAAQSIERYCNAPRGNGRAPCKRPAGWGTPNQTGPCKLHGGALPSVQKHHARVAALTFARGALGQELDIDPLEGVLLAVRLSYGVVDHYRHQLHTQPEHTDPAELQHGYEKALVEYTRICQIAVNAGVAERQIKIIERVADQLGLLFEEVAAAINATGEQRQLMRAAWVKGLERLEEPAIDGTAVEDKAA